MPAIIKSGCLLHNNGLLASVGLLTLSNSDLRFRNQRNEHLLICLPSWSHDVFSKQRLVNRPSNIKATQRCVSASNACWCAFYHWVSHCVFCWTKQRPVNMLPIWVTKESCFQHIQLCDQPQTQLAHQLDFCQTKCLRLLTEAYLCLKSEFCDSEDVSQTWTTKYVYSCLIFYQIPGYVR